MVIFYEIKSLGNYCLAADIGDTIKRILNDSEFFKNLSTDGSERVGKWVNAEAAKIFQKDRQGVVEAMDVISLNLVDNSEFITKLCDDGVITSYSYKRHGKLDMYSPKLAELIIRSMTNNLSYSINNDYTVFIDYRDIPVVPVHNDIALKYLFKAPKSVKLATRKKLLTFAANSSSDKSSAVDLVAHNSDAVNAEACLLAAFESTDGIQRRYAGRNVLDMFPEVAKKWIRLYFKVCKSTVDVREQLLKEGAFDIENWAAAVLSEYSNKFGK